MRALIKHNPIAMNEIHPSLVITLFVGIMLIALMLVFVYWVWKINQSVNKLFRLAESSTKARSTPVKNSDIRQHPIASPVSPQVEPKELLLPDRNDSGGRFVSEALERYSVSLKEFSDSTLGGLTKLPAELTSEDNSSKRVA